MLASFRSHIECGVVDQVCGCVCAQLPAKAGTSPHLVASYGGHADAVESVAVSPDGSRLVSSGWDGSLRVWRMGQQVLEEAAAAAAAGGGGGEGGKASTKKRKVGQAVRECLLESGHACRGSMLARGRFPEKHTCRGGASSLTCWCGTCLQGSWA